MRALMLEPPEELLAERRRKGDDRWDEMWDGLLHMVPPPSRGHQSFGRRLLHALEPAAESLGLEIDYETGLFRPGTGERDYRRPDLVAYRAQNGSDRGVEGRAELVVEILSPRDESRQKLDFYAACGVQEVLLVDPTTREFEHHVLRGEKYFAALPDDRGLVRCSVLGVTFSVVGGPKFRVSTASGFTDV
jgi:Uma2 family endonuclease